MMEMGHALIFVETCGRVVDIDGHRMAGFRRRVLDSDCTVWGWQFLDVPGRQVRSNHETPLP
jgi:hypothetical protein